MFSVSPVSGNYSFRLPSLRDRGLCIHISVGQNSGHNETPSKSATSVISAERGVCEQTGFAYQAHKLFVQVQGFYSCEAIFSSWHERVVPRRSQQLGTSVNYVLLADFTDRAVKPRSLQKRRVYKRWERWPCVPAAKLRFRALMWIPRKSHRHSEVTDCVLIESLWDEKKHLKRCQLSLQ